MSFSMTWSSVWMAIMQAKVTMRKVQGQAQVSSHINDLLVTLCYNLFVRLLTCLKL